MTFSILDPEIATRVIDVIRLAEEIFEMKTEFSIEKRMENEKECVIADIEKARLELEWGPKCDIKSALKSMSSKMSPVRTHECS